MSDIDSVPRKIPLGRKVRAGLGALLALLVIVAGVAIALIVNLSRSDARVEDDVPYATAIASASLDAKSVANDQRGFLLTGDPMYQREADQHVAAVRRDFAAAERAATTAEERGAASESSTGFERWWTATQAEFATYRAGNKQAAIAASVGPNRVLRKQYEESLQQTRNLGQSSLQSATRWLPRSATQAVLILLGCLLAALLAGALIAYWLIRQISMPLFRLAAMLTAEPL
ncbi:CHASE3 domain-containing protein [Kribbella sp. NPDC055110]